MCDRPVRKETAAQLQTALAVAEWASATLVAYAEAACNAANRQVAAAEALNAASTAHVSLCPCRVAPVVQL